MILVYTVQWSYSETLQCYLDSIEATSWLEEDKTWVIKPSHRILAVKEARWWPGFGCTARMLHCSIDLGSVWSNLGDLLEKLQLQPLSENYDPMGPSQWHWVHFSVHLWTFASARGSSLGEGRTGWPSRPALPCTPLLLWLATTGCLSCPQKYWSLSQIDRNSTTQRCTLSICSARAFSNVMSPHSKWPRYFACAFEDGRSLPKRKNPTKHSANTAHSADTAHNPNLSLCFVTSQWVLSRSNIAGVIGSLTCFDGEPLVDWILWIPACMGRSIGREELSWGSGKPRLMCMLRVTDMYILIA